MLIYIFQDQLYKKTFQLHKRHKMENNKLQVILSYRTRKQTRTVITNWTGYTCQQTRCLPVQNILL